MPLKAEVVRREAGLPLADLPGWANAAIGDSLSELHHLDGRIAESDERGRQLMDGPGIGPTTASGLLANIDNGHDFKCGRQVSAWLSLLPGLYSSGGKQWLGRITKTGDSYLRCLLVLGDRAVLVSSNNKTDRLSRFDEPNLHGVTKALMSQIGPAQGMLG